MEKPPRAPRNQTLTLSPHARAALYQQLYTPTKKLLQTQMQDRIFCGDLAQLIPFFPAAVVDLLILDPPYNLDKNFHGLTFRRRDEAAYTAYLDDWLTRLRRLLKPTASVYLCGDWQSSAAMYTALTKHFIVRNRITWQREKGRGARANWKNCSEDIWFATCSETYYFDAAAVRLQRRVRAPYRENGKPKDWQATAAGNFRLTAPANFWDDLTVPYWSMPENTDHPTQKPEKLLAKLILASSRPHDFIFDPFLGSGTTAVVAKKLGRHFGGVEINPEYGAWALARLQQAATDSRIQGYTDGVFWERNSYPAQLKTRLR